MNPIVPGVLLLLLAVYLVVGVFVGVSFVVRRVAKIDPAAENASLGFRLVIVPAAIALWPLLLARWIRGRNEPPAENTEHKRRAR